MSMKLKKEPWTPNVGKKLNEKELSSAMKELIIPNFRQLERGFVDPGIPNQCVALFSFVPCEQPNKYGLFGFAKIRGVFASDFEAMEQSRKIIKHFDSSNPIHHVRVGHSFPIGANIHGNWENIVLDDELAEAEASVKVREDEREETERKYFEKRRKELMDDVKPNKQIPMLERYIMLRQKYANMGVMHEEYSKQIPRMEQIAQSAYDEIKKLEIEHPMVLEQYQEEYQKTRRECGLDKDISDEGIKIKQVFDAMPIFPFIVTERQTQ
jgi:hypothetical protein